MSLQTSSITIGPWTITDVTEMTEVYSSSPVTDKGWKVIDAAGHGHFWRDGYPTLTWVEDEPWFCEEHAEMHENGHWECPHCAERITPGRKPPSPLPALVRGPRHVELVYDDGRDRREYDITSHDDVSAIMADPVANIPVVAGRLRPRNEVRTYSR